MKRKTKLAAVAMVVLATVVLTTFTALAADSTAKWGALLDKPDSSDLRDNAKWGANLNGATATPATRTATRTSTDAIATRVEAAVAEAAGTNVYVRVINNEVITPDTIAAVNRVAGTKNVTLYADTTEIVENVTMGRIYLEPAKLTAVNEDIKLGVYVDNARAEAVQTLFNRAFDNKTAVIDVQQDNLYVRTQIAVKLDLTGFDASSLRIYNYDIAENKYYPIENSQYFIDENGYLRFYTDEEGTAGYIVVSDGRLPGDVPYVAPVVDATDVDDDDAAADDAAADDAADDAADAPADDDAGAEDDAE